MKKFTLSVCKSIYKEKCFNIYRAEEEIHTKLLQALCIENGFNIYVIYLNIDNVNVIFFPIYNLNKLNTQAIK